MVATLRAEVAAAGHGTRFEHPRPIRWAKTVEGETDYPTAISNPNTYPIVFLDGTFTQAQGTQSPTWSQRQNAPCTVVHDVSGARDSYIPIGTIIPVWPDRGRWWTDWHWPPVVHITLTENIGAGASGNIQLPDGRLRTATNWGGAGVVDDKAIAWRTLHNGTWYFMKPGTGGGGGGSGTNTKLYATTLYANLESDGATTTVGTLQSVTAGIPDVAGPVAGVINASKEVGLFGDYALVLGHDGPSEGSPFFSLLRVVRGDETLECTVYTPFSKNSATFSAYPIRSYNGRTVPGPITVHNQVAPGHTDPFLFEGEFGAVCRVQRDPSTGLFRAVWVECPEDPPVSEEESSNNLTVPLSMFGEAAAASQGVF